MDAKIMKAIEFLADKISGNVTSGEALQYTQAAVNLANAQRCIADTKEFEKQNP